MGSQDRGIIINKRRKQQINNFSQLMYEKITPTDLDGLIEYKNKGYIIFEIKYKNAKLPNGQKLAIERMINDFNKSGKNAIAMVAEHCIDNPNNEIFVGDCIIREIYNGNKWRNTKTKNMKLKECSDLFIKYLQAKK